nr:AbrB/MazE/SpoVT family DNA-binding domain-containing protein [Polymorphobacter sp.]
MANAQEVITTVSTKGQVILPSDVRRRRRWDAGTKLVVEETAEGVLLRAAARFPPTTSDEVFGMLKYDGPPISIEDMNAAVDDYFATRARD